MCRASGSTARARLVAACDTSEELLEQRRGQWGIDRVTTDPEVLCADPDIDAVIIATPNFTHRPIALAAARGGKHIMCEKPLGLSAGEVREMYHAARDAGVVHMTAFTYRFAPAMRYLKHLLDSGALGRAAGIFAVSGFWTGPKPVGGGANIRTRPAPAICST